MYSILRAIRNLFIESVLADDPELRETILPSGIHMIFDKQGAFMGYVKDENIEDQRKGLK